jgi:hypothetical protein
LENFAFNYSIIAGRRIGEKTRKCQRRDETKKISQKIERNIIWSRERMKDKASEVCDVDLLRSVLEGTQTLLPRPYEQASKCCKVARKPVVKSLQMITLKKRKSRTGTIP